MSIVIDEGSSNIDNCEVAEYSGVVVTLLELCNDIFEDDIPMRDSFLFLCLK